MSLFNANNFSDAMLDIILREYSLGKKIFYKYINGDVKYFAHYINDNCLKANYKHRLYSLDLEESFIVTLSLGDEILFPNNYTYCSDCSNGKHMPTPPPYPCDPKKTKRCREGCETRGQDDCWNGNVGDYCWRGEPEGGSCLASYIPHLVCASNNVMVPEDDYITVGTCQTGIPTPAPPPTPAPSSCKNPGEHCGPPPLTYTNDCCYSDSRYYGEFFECSFNLPDPKNPNKGTCVKIPHRPGIPREGNPCTDECDPPFLECCHGTCEIPGSCW